MAAAHPHFTMSEDIVGYCCSQLYMDTSRENAWNYAPAYRIITAIACFLSLRAGKETKNEEKACHQERDLGTRMTSQMAAIRTDKAVNFCIDNAPAWLAPVCRRANINILDALTLNTCSQDPNPNLKLDFVHNIPYPYARVHLLWLASSATKKFNNRYRTL